MKIKNLSIQRLRNLEPCKLRFSNHINIFYGANGAGKTSVLEALYTLGNGRSFRTGRHAKVIHQQQDDFTLFAEINSMNISQKLGLQRKRSGEVKIRLNNQPINKLSNLAATFPVQILAPEQYELLSKGSSGRRKLLDWGVFHVEHSFLSLWQRCLKALSQRNQLLKSGADKQQLSSWDKQLVPMSEALDLKRKNYCQKLNPIFQSIAKQFLPNVELELKLYSGWTSSKPLAELLQIQYDKDRRVGFTHSSVQKADLKLYSGKQLAVEFLSRGQQKLVITALKLAQLKLMQKEAEQYPIFLLDDIGAELDKEHQRRLLQFLSKQPEQQQIFISCVHLDPLMSLIKGYNGAKLFHVEHGVISEV